MSHLSKGMLGLPIKIIEHTGRIFSSRYEEHRQVMINKNGNSECSNHLLNTGHTYSSITNSMDFVGTRERGNHVKSLGKYHINFLRKDNLNTIETYIDTYNIIFEAL
jgi:hypothetical protein